MSSKKLIGLAALALALSGSAAFAAQEGSTADDNLGYTGDIERGKNVDPARVGTQGEQTSRENEDLRDVPGAAQSPTSRPGAATPSQPGVDSPIYPPEGRTQVPMEDRSALWVVVGGLGLALLAFFIYRMMRGEDVPPTRTGPGPRI